MSIGMGIAEQQSTGLALGALEVKIGWFLLILLWG